MRARTHTRARTHAHTHTFPLLEAVRGWPRPFSFSDLPARTPYFFLWWDILKPQPQKHFCAFRGVLTFKIYRWLNNETVITQ